MALDECNPEQAEALQFVSAGRSHLIIGQAVACSRLSRSVRKIQKTTVGSVRATSGVWFQEPRTDKAGRAWNVRARDKHFARLRIQKSRNLSVAVSGLFGRDYQ